MQEEDEILSLFKRAEITLDSARKLLELKKDPTSIVNRAYYAVFYSALAFLKSKGIRLETSKHTGVISAFDTHIVRADKMKWKKFSMTLHKLFDSRQHADYDFRLDEPTIEEAKELFDQAQEFFDMILQS